MFTLLYEILIKIFGDVLSNSFKDIIENKIFHVGKKIRCSEIIEEPNLIMGDRGLESDGFLKNLYYHRNVDDALLKYVKEGIVVIEGRPASGKSRVVWEFIRKSAGAYKSVYIPKGSVSDAEYSKKLKGEVGRLSKSTLIVIDEIESLWDKKHLDETSLSLLLQTINERELPCIITISNFNEHYEDICKTIRKDASLGSRKGRKINFVTIRDIERDDDTFCWCMANMPVRKYAKVIGGYNPRLSRYYNATIKNIIETNKAAVAYLATFNILIMFRNRTRVLQERMKELYLAIKENDKSWKLPEWEEILREETGTADILFKSGILKNQDGSIEIDDNFLYESFIDSCIIKVKGKDDISMIVTKYLSDTCASEKEQICRLIDMEKGKDPSIISRIVARSRYEDNRKYAIDCFKERFFEYKNNQLKVRPDCDAAISPELSFACSLIASRDPDPIACSKEFLEAGIKPNIIFVSEIIRAAYRKSSDDGKELVKYAQSLKDQYSLEPNLYYWQVVETFEAGYDEYRIKEGIRLYSKIYEDSSMDEEEVDNQRATFEGFCRALIMKADSSERMDQYFELLENNSELVFSKSSIKKLIYRISDRYGVNSSPILEKLSNKLLGIINDSDKTEVCNTGLICIIGQCMDVSAALNIYESIKKYAGLIKDKAKKNSFLNIITMSLTRKMREIKRDSDEYKKIRDEIKDRIESSKSEDYNGNSNTGAVLKLFNAFLNNQPLYPSGDSLEKMLELYNDTSLFSGKKDIDTLNSAFHNVLDANEKYDSKSDVIAYCERLKTIGRKFNELRQESKLTADGRFKLFMFKVIEKIKFADKDGKVNTEDIRSLIDFCDDISEATAPNLCSDELLWCQVVKLSNDIDLLYKIAGQCIQMIDESGIYLTNLTNHLFSVFYQKFPKEKEFRDELEELEKRTYNLISNTVFDYQHYLGFDACTGSIKTKDDVVSFINEAWTRLQHINKPLRENKGDLLCTAINLKFISFEDAVDIIKLAIEYDRKLKYRSSTILTVDVIVELAKKFQNEAAMRTREEDKRILREYAKNIQLLVDKLSYIDYPSEEFFQNNINRYVKYWRTIRMPLASDNEFIRRAAFENRIDENGSLRCRKYEAECFLDRELYFSNKAIINDNNRNDSQISNIDDNIKYIIWVIEKTLDAGLQLDVEALNDKRYCEVYRERNGHMGYYDNFFQGYLAEGYVPESSVDEWAQIAQKCGFSVECSNL